MNTLTLSVDNSSFDSAGITKDSQDAICEFIWNALEASANKVEITIHGGDLTESGAIVISDNGMGIPYESLQDTFGAFLSSQKRNQSIRIKSQTNKGKGRFSYLALASSALWQTVYELEGHLFSYEIKLSAINKTNIERTEKTEIGDASAGTTVTIPISDSKTNAELQYQKIKGKLLQEFAWYLYLHKDRHISIMYCGEELQYTDYINTELSRECTIDIEGHSFIVSIIVWKNKIDNSSKIYYMDAEGGLCDAENTHFNKNAANFFHGAFARSSYFSETPVLTGADDDAALVEYEEGQRDIMRRLKKEIRAILDTVLREYLLKRADEYLSEEKTVKAFPTFSSDAMGEARKNDFQRVARELYCVEPRIFYHLKKQQAKTLFGFMALLLDSDERENILSIVEQIVDLTSEQRAKLAAVLKQTRLEHIIEVIDMLQQRYDVIYTLREIVYDRDLARFANERDHIQRIVENHYWLFGDQYSLVSADITVKNSLASFETMLGEQVSSTSALSPEELRQRMDIVLYGSRWTESNQFEGLVVELKAPSVVLTSEVLHQIVRYANQIRREPRFSGQDRRWKFYAVCASIDDDVESIYEGYKSHNKPGLVHITGNFEVYALTWDDIFTGFDQRYRFIAQKMKADYELYLQENADSDTPSGRELIDAKVEALVNLGIVVDG
ncbi:MAG: ATP-binding protein [Oscillospiraceae bacterium]|nr:ATP-binding protein [Oscillospiraceae bacterium]